MRTSAPLLRVRDLSITHAGATHPSPREISFDLHPGEIVLLIGPSGSGKSTLTLALNGLIPQSVSAEVTGTVEVAGLDAADTPVARLSEHVAMVFQDPDAQLVTGTVLDEVAFALENQLLPVAEVLSRTEAALRRVGLWDRRSWNPDLLSGGGRQRLAIACALAMGSRLLVLDEPTANLDPQGTAEVHAAIADLVAAGDRAVLLVEHEYEAALEFATRVLELGQDGRLVHDGPAAEWGSSATEHAVGAALGSEAQHGLGAEGTGADARTPGASGPAVSVHDLRVVKQRDEILRVDDLEIAAGSFTAVIGANGAGKTTLIQALAGVVPPAAGTVRIADLDAGTAAPRQLAARVGFVFQNPEHQFIAHTVFDELAHGLRLQRVPADEVETRVAEVLDRFDLTHKAQTHPFLLSGGEKRRLSVGTAIISRPQVLVLDEPTFGQDRDRAAELLGLLAELQREGTTIVVVTHDLRLVAEHATHTVVLADGRMLASGPTVDLLADLAVLEHASLLPRTAAYAPADASTAVGSTAETTRGPAASGAGAAPLSTTGPHLPGEAADAPTAPHLTDPYAEAPLPRRFWLHHLNPLAKALPVLPAIALLVFTRDLLTPALFLALSYLVIVSGARLTRRSALLLFGAVPVGLAVIALGFSLWASPALIAGTPGILSIGDWTLHTGALAIGATTALRLGSILALALIGGLTTTGPDLVRSGVQQLRVPYRIGYTALAAYRFVPRFGYELSIIRAAHRVRGHHGGNGPFARLARGWGYIVPLLASGIRHAERVALAMDARAFGAHPTRTERHLVPWRVRDTVFTIVVLTVSGVILFTTFPWIGAS